MSRSSLLRHPDLSWERAPSPSGCACLPSAPRRRRRPLAVCRRLAVGPLTPSAPLPTCRSDAPQREGGMEQYGNATTYNLELVLVQNIKRGLYWDRKVKDITEWSELVDEIYERCARGGKVETQGEAYCEQQHIPGLRALPRARAPPPLLSLSHAPHALLPPSLPAPVCLSHAAACLLHLAHSALACP